jgi:hypothetical protein
MAFSSSFPSGFSVGSSVTRYFFVGDSDIGVMGECCMKFVRSLEDS